MTTKKNKPAQIVARGKTVILVLSRSEAETLLRALGESTGLDAYDLYKLLFDHFNPEPTT